MGVDLSKLVKKQDLTINKVKYKKVAVATYAELFKSLKSKNQTQDKNGKSTTHISSMFFKASNLIRNKMKPCFVLNGRFPEVKRHQKITNEVPPPRKTNMISHEMIAEIKHLFDLMGIPVVQAPTEEEAQAAHLAMRDEVWAVASTKWDAAVHGAPRVLIHVTNAKQKKIPRKSDFQLTSGQLIETKKLLKDLKIDSDQLIILSMLLGTKFNPAIVGLNPKQALHLVHKWKDFGKLFKYAGWNYAYTWKEVYDCIKTLPVTNKYKLKWGKPKKDQLFEYLVSDKNLPARKVQNTLEILQ